MLLRLLLQGAYIICVCRPRSAVVRSHAASEPDCAPRVVYGVRLPPTVSSNDLYVASTVRTELTKRCWSAGVLGPLRPVHDYCLGQLTRRSFPTDRVSAESSLCLRKLLDCATQTAFAAQEVQVHNNCSFYECCRADTSWATAVVKLTAYR